MSEQTWRLEGDYFEACNCQLTLAWHVRDGFFGQTRLDPGQLQHAEPEHDQHECPAA